MKVVYIPLKSGMIPLLIIFMQTLIILPGSIPGNYEHCTGARSFHGQLPAAVATRVDASSMNAASVYSCSAYEIRVRLARSTSSQDMSIVVSTDDPSACGDDAMQVQIDKAASIPHRVR